ncbi:unnamed protein product [Prunus armeniaca]|uniref:Uncharacterized protein n=1 Tax=Prunus armeniaca TaxID=36596 RepID=A0A6J5XG12_PRUAR|nr:unnamed protein product [Prunus armeniaca]
MSPPIIPSPSAHQPTSPPTVRLVQPASACFPSFSLQALSPPQVASCKLQPPSSSNPTATPNKVGILSDSP